MKKNLLVAAAIVTVLVLVVNNPRAQTPAAPAPPQAGGPLTAPQARTFGRPRQSDMIMTRTIMNLRMAKAQLQHSTNDYEGHRESALQACDKALSELEAVVKASVDEKKKEQQQPPAGTPPATNTPAAGAPATPPPATVQTPVAPSQP